MRSIPIINAKEWIFCIQHQCVLHTIESMFALIRNPLQLNYFWININHNQNWEGAHYSASAIVANMPNFSCWVNQSYFSHLNNYNLYRNCAILICPYKNCQTNQWSNESKPQKGDFKAILDNLKTKTKLQKTHQTKI